MCLVILRHQASLLATLYSVKAKAYSLHSRKMLAIGNLLVKCHVEFKLLGRVDFDQPTMCLIQCGCFFWELFTMPIAE